MHVSYQSSLKKYIISIQSQQILNQTKESNEKLKIQIKEAEEERDRLIKEIEKKENTWANLNSYEIGIGEQRAEIGIQIYQNDATTYIHGSYTSVQCLYNPD